MNSFTKALQGAVDKVSGVSRVDNGANPTSALNMQKRKRMNTPTVSPAKPIKTQPSYK